MELRRVIRKSLEDYRKNWKKCLIISVYTGIMTVIYTLISVLFKMMGMFFISLVIDFLYPVITIGISFSYLKIVRNEKLLLSKNLFVGFKNPMKIIIISFLKDLFSILWGLLLIIPGVIKTYAYSQAEFIYLDNQEFGVTQYLGFSSDLMENKKMGLFGLQLLMYPLPQLILIFLGYVIFHGIVTKDIMQSFMNSLFFMSANLFISPLYGLIYANFYSFLADGDEGAGERNSIWTIVLVVALIILTVLSFILFMNSFGY